MKTYTSAELEKLAEGVFVDDPKAASVYADENGTFKNVLQYETLSDEDKAKFTEFKNPSVDVDSTSVELKLSQVAKERDELKSQLETANAELVKMKADLDKANQQLLDQA